jgi:hypothetical protein
MQFNKANFLKIMKTKMPVNPNIYGHLVLFENRIVESGRVELPSKQATKKLSTRLFPDLVFDFVVGQEQPHIA